MTGRTASLACGLALVAVLAISVVPRGSRAFTGGHRLSVTSPAPLALVSVPFAIKWQASPSAGHRFTVFVDIPPIAPGHGLRDLATTQCKRAPRCQPTTDYLRGLGVYPAARSEVTVVFLRKLAGTGSRAPHPVHTATVVAMDDSGRRAGDLAWEVQFRA